LIDWIVCPNVGAALLVELPMSFCAKKASTTTIRIGNAALLKKRLMFGLLAPSSGCDSSA
jgi:hypothetical protein